MITKKEFMAYRRVQVAGAYNMLSAEAIAATGLPYETYLTIISNYDDLLNRFEGAKTNE